VTVEGRVRHRPLIVPRIALERMTRVEFTSPLSNLREAAKKMNQAAGE
jgi:hypothetical protein